jgi:glycyl-tRNA synthetase beta chain
LIKDALLEIGSEELPSSFVPMGMKQLQAIAEKSLKEHQLAFKSICVFGTPRRLAILIHDLAGTSPNQERRVSGPPADKAKDANGQWTPAAQGFARKYGLRPTDLIVESGKLCAVQHIKGVPTRQLLAELYPQWVAGLEFPKAMVWEPTKFRFPRPIRWFAAMYGADLVLFALAGVRSGRFTYGLSLQSSKKVPITQAGKYMGLLKNQCVLADPSARREAIQKLSDQTVKRIHGHVLMREALLDEVSFLVEHPVAILGNYDPAYLQLPREVLVTCIEHHQKFFPVEEIPSPTGRGIKGEGGLLPHFVGIRNGVSVHQELVKEGYERVLAARLSDARFFYTQDRRTPLTAKVDALRGVTFQKNLGTLFDKKERVKGLLDAMGQKLGWGETERNQAQRAADLCKADLVTEMVGEFPELQGIVARLYALADKEDAVVAKALEEHYWPITLAGALPTSSIAAAVAVADKLDTLAGDFAIGLIPSGSADPYGLRRAAVGVLRILESQKWAIPLEWLIDQALNVLPKEVVTQHDKTRQDLIQFMRQRLTGQLQERSFLFDEIDAVLAVQIGVVHETLERLKALHDIRARPEFGPLSISFKRAMNIVRQANPREALQGITTDQDSGVRVDLLQDPSEQTLFHTFQDLHQHLERHLQGGSYGPALESMVTLRDPLDKFFSGVMVLAEDPSLRANRLALLSGIVRLFLRIADFSKLQNA